MFKSISFCTSCRNRLWQLRQTLPNNLASLNADHEIVLVDYGSTDDLSGWVWSNFKTAIETARLVFFEVKNDVRWNVARAKNLAHRLASGQYLFNLDADNFITPNDVQEIQRAATSRMLCWQFSRGNRGDGSFGRIGLPADLFQSVGGYDETLLPMGCQDADLLVRLGRLKHTALQLNPPTIPAIDNSIEQKLLEVNTMNLADFDPTSAYNAMDATNQQFSKIKLATEGPIRVGGGFSYRGLLNGERITIDGFNVIRREV